MLLLLHDSTAAVIAFVIKVPDWGLATCFASCQTGCWLLHTQLFGFGGFFLNQEPYDILKEDSDLT